MDSKEKKEIRFTLNSSVVIMPSFGAEAGGASERKKREG